MRLLRNASCHHGEVAISAELQLAYGVTGRALYAVIRTATGTVWNGAAFAAFVGANWATYAVTMTEQGTSGFYVGNFPVVAAGTYSLEVRDQSGGSPSLADAVAGSGSLSWDGTAVTIDPTGTQFADALLARNNAGGSNGGRTVSQSMQTIRNKVAIVGTTLTVYAEDDTTILYTATITSDASANPITASAPTT